MSIDLVIVLILTVIVVEIAFAAPSGRRRDAGDRNDWPSENRPETTDLRVTAQTTAAPRFRGNWVVAAPPRKRPDAPSPARPRLEADGAQRFGGRIYVAPTAFGAACGRPVAECTRGPHCLCID